jgi:hypothetical protein
VVCWACRSDVCSCSWAGTWRPASFLVFSPITLTGNRRTRADSLHKSALCVLRLRSSFVPLFLEPFHQFGAPVTNAAAEFVVGGPCLRVRHARNVCSSYPVNCSTAHSRQARRLDERSRRTAVAAARASCDRSFGAVKKTEHEKTPQAMQSVPGHYLCVINDLAADHSQQRFCFR